MTEDEIIAGCRRGNREAQRLLYEQTVKQIFRLLVRMTGDAELASDLVQDTYLKAFGSIAQFNGQASLSTWLYRIAVNDALHHRRRKQPLFLAPDSPTMLSQAAAPSSDTVARLDLDAALSSLDPTDQAILLLRYQEGLDYRTVADVVGCPMGTVASRLNRARTRLRRLLSEEPTAREEKPSLAHPIVVDQAPAVK